MNYWGFLQQLQKYFLCITQNCKQTIKKYTDLTVSNGMLKTVRNYRSIQDFFLVLNKFFIVPRNTWYTGLLAAGWSSVIIPRLTT